ncbi:MAG: dockerin type I repeat-containing protein, partial [bacterium]
FNPTAYDAKYAITNPINKGTTVASKSAREKAAQDEFLRPSFIKGGDFDILSDFATCPFPEKPGSVNCVIDNNFRMAIESKMTVGNALKEGYLEKGWKFENGLTYNEGYSIRNIILLRRYRILPVGWEIAAEYIDKFAMNKDYNLQKLVDCYSPDDEWDETQTSEDWCRGLVDPDWLLKVPAYSCENMAAYGQDIITEQYIPGVDANKDGSYEMLPKRIVMRNQSCINDDSCLIDTDDGKCLKWGDCVEEKRIWRFEGASCDENFNTCQEFTKVSSEQDDETAGYLKNTIDYRGCDASTAGCARYCAEGEWNNDSGAVLWQCGLALSDGKSLLFDRDAENCDDDAQGCHKFISLNDDANLVYNGGFDKSAQPAIADNKFNFWPVEGAGANIALVDGKAKIEANGAGKGIYSYDMADTAKKDLSVMPEEFSFERDKRYVLSADVKVETGKMEIGFSGDGVKKNDMAGEGRIEVILEVGEIFADKIFIRSAGDGNNIFYVDNISLRETAQNEARNYANYGDNAVYIKKAPDYLARGTVNEDERAKYAAGCSEKEAGCSKYTPVNGDPWIPAISSFDDFCDYECVNYKPYSQKAANFSKEVPNIKFIADSPYLDVNSLGKVCSAKEVGCAEFTNLDELEKGGEGREYYTYLKQCVKTNADGAPLQEGDEAPAVCATFYTWTGSDTAGYQLKTHYLKKNSNNLTIINGNPNQPNGPFQISNPQNFGSCVGPEDVKENPNCSEFYNEAGQTFYAIYHNTVICEENCHPYRKTRENINESECTVYGSGWMKNQDVSDNSAIVNIAGCDSNSDCVCKLEIENCLYSGGKWKNNECVYMANPDDGIKCSAQNAGCFEYKGTTSENVRIILNNDFESKTNDGWIGADPSSASRIVGEQCLRGNENGENAVKDLTSSNVIVSRDKIYNILFLASSSQGEREVNIIFKGPDFYAKRDIKLSSKDWQTYNIGSIILSGDLSNNGDGDGKIDATDLAILDKAIANPMSVTARQRELSDINGDGRIDGAIKDGAREAGTDYKLLEEFIGLGSLSAQTIEIIGIDENIYLDNIVMKEVLENIYRIKDSWEVPEKCDSPMMGAQLWCAEYTDMSNRLVQMKSFSNLCPSSAIGCEKMIDTYNSESVFETTVGGIIVPRDRVVYFVNDRSKYCLVEDKGCERFGVPKLNQDKTALAGYAPDVFIKNDPDLYGNILCSETALGCEEWQWNNGNETGSSYFKDPLDKVCEYKDGVWMKFGQSAVCPVETNIYKTIGDKTGTQVEVPSGGWAGLCPSDQNGCAEYIDILSNNQVNLVYNGNFEKDDAALGAGADGPDGWSGVAGCGAGCDSCCSSGYGNSKSVRTASQNIVLSENTLYTVSAKVKGTGSIILKNCAVSSPDGSAEISINNAKIAFSKTAMEIVSGRIYVSDIPSLCILEIAGGSTAFVDEVNVQETDVYYNIAGTISKSGCEGGKNDDAGCVEVEERKYSACSGNEEPWVNESNIGGCIQSSNQIIKASPDRVCGKWLSAGETIIGEDGIEKVLIIKECSALEDSGDCAFEILREKKNMVFDRGSYSLMENISGFSKIGFDWGGNNKIEGYYPLSSMRETGQYIKFNGSFEKVDITTGKPFDWDPVEGDWSSSMKIINNPVAAQSGETLDPKAPEGRNFLKLIGGKKVESEELPVVGNVKYTITAFINSKNLLSESRNGKAVVYARAYSLSNGAINIKKDETGEEVEFISLELKEGDGWTFLTARFETLSGTGKLKITLENIGDNDLQGDSYFDDINIMSSLELMDNGIAGIEGNGYSSSISEGISPSICKSFAEESSLGCEYIGESGMNYKGQSGYCLEYDRAPGDPNICVSWFPADLASGGDVMTEIPPMDFGGKPLYYCLEAQFLEKRHVAQCKHDSEEYSGGCLETCGRTGYCRWHKDDENDGWCVPNEPAVYTDSSNLRIDWPFKSEDEKDGACGEFGHTIGYSGYYDDEDGAFYHIDFSAKDWFYYNGDLEMRCPFNINTDRGEDKLDVDKEGPEDFQIRCVKIAQVVDDEGNSVVWADRLKPESEYEVPTLKYRYASESSPYGALSITNLTTTDAFNIKYDLSVDTNGAIKNEKGDKFSYKIIKTGMGLPYSCANPSGYCEAPQGLDIDIGIENDVNAAIERLKRLFVKGYKEYEWSDGNKKYEDKDKYLWNLPEICKGTERGDDENCAILPKIDSIIIENRNSGNICVGISDSILLGFNMIIDKEQ